jgi:hypothetical protein
MKDWSGNSRAPFAALGSSEHSARARAQNDYYATDPKAIDALDKLLPLNGLHIWECACGEGHLSKRMEYFGAKVVSTDLYDRNYGTPSVDFLKQTRLLAPVIVTNPPYKYAQEFVEKSLRLGADKVCMFLKLTFLEGQKRRSMFDATPPRQWLCSVKEYRWLLTETLKSLRKVALYATLGIFGSKAIKINLG